MGKNWLKRRLSRDINVTNTSSEKSSDKTWFLNPLKRNNKSVEPLLNQTKEHCDAIKKYAEEHLPKLESDKFTETIESINKGIKSCKEYYDKFNSKKSRNDVLNIIKEYNNHLRELEFKALKQGVKYHSDTLAKHAEQFSEFAPPDFGETARDISLQADKLTLEKGALQDHRRVLTDFQNKIQELEHQQITALDEGIRVRYNELKTWAHEKLTQSKLFKGFIDDISRKAYDLDDSHPFQERAEPLADGNRQLQKLIDNKSLLEENKNSSEFIKIIGRITNISNLEISNSSDLLRLSNTSDYLTEAEKHENPQKFVDDLDTNIGQCVSQLEGKLDQFQTSTLEGSPLNRGITKFWKKLDNFNEMRKEAKAKIDKCFSSSNNQVFEQGHSVTKTPDFRTGLRSLGQCKRNIEELQKLFDQHLKIEKEFFQRRDLLIQWGLASNECQAKCKDVLGCKPEKLVKTLVAADTERRIELAKILSQTDMRNMHQELDSLDDWSKQAFQDQEKELTKYLQNTASMLDYKFKQDYQELLKATGQSERANSSPENEPLSSPDVKSQPLQFNEELQILQDTNSSTDQKLEYLQEYLMRLNQTRDSASEKICSATNPHDYEQEFTLFEKCNDTIKGLKDSYDNWLRDIKRSTEEINEKSQELYNQLSPYEDQSKDYMGSKPEKILLTLDKELTDANNDISKVNNIREIDRAYTSLKQCHEDLKGRKERLDQYLKQAEEVANSIDNEFVKIHSNLPDHFIRKESLDHITAKREEVMKDLVNYKAGKPNECKLTLKLALESFVWCNKELKIAIAKAEQLWGWLDETTS